MPRPFLNFKAKVSIHGQSRTVIGDTRMKKAVNYFAFRLLGKAMAFPVPLTLLVLSVCGAGASVFLGWRLAIPSAVLAIAGTGLVLANMAISVQAIHQCLLQIYEQGKKTG
jgi:hypothetical protein